jgi:pimeloyl-ACP methyl ester carboxylesterase
LGRDPVVHLVTREPTGEGRGRDIDGSTSMNPDDAERWELDEDSVAQLGGGFASGIATANGTTIHYVRGGHGPALVLLHGFPQDWFEWRRLMPRLAERFTVIAVDLRGVGGSAAPADGYAAADLARDVHELVGALGIDHAHLVGHDIGGWVAYAFARLYPDSTGSVLIMESPIPGIEPFLHLEIDVPLWHGEFHMIPDLPERLVAGREAIYFRYFFDVGTNDNSVITDADVEHYANAYGDPDHLRSAFEVYRALPANMTFNAGRTARIDVPLLLVGGEHVFGPVMPALAENLRAHHGWTDVHVEVLENGRHYLAEERPDDVAELIERHAAVSGHQAC